MKASGVLVLCASLLASAPARAARYDPDFDRAALRQAATVAHSTVVEATGRALEPDQAAAIAAGLDEGLRLARLASAAAASLDGAARRRDLEMEAAVKASSGAKDQAEAVSAESARARALGAEQSELREQVRTLPDDERKKKLAALLDKASDGLAAASDALRPLEAAHAAMGERALEMKEARSAARGPLVEISSAAAGVITRAEELPPGMAEAKSRLAALGAEPRDAARARAWEKLEPLRDVSRLLFQAADAAGNRADDFRRRSASFDKEHEAFARARAAASAGPGAAKALLDEARRTLTAVRERLKSPGP